jgi:alkylation response protein AidB-like acyl-CoA dehydrogenase
MTAAVVRQWLDAGKLNLPLPGSGATGQRWRALAALAEADIVAGRIAEAHLDAVAILDELGGKPQQPVELWGVWAAEVRSEVLTVSGDDEVVLDGVKSWCSGAGFCTHALVTAQRADGERGLYAVAVEAPAVTALPNWWRNPGMAESDTRSVQFTAARAVAVGDPGAYLSRPGFWHGAVGVAACWLGGARAVAAPLYRKARDEHALAHLGAVDAALAAAEALLDSVAGQFDADPFDRAGRGELLARRARAVVEHAVDEAITRTGRALGPGPLAMDEAHARNVADLGIYVRQSHAEKDLAALGRLAGKQLAGEQR